jgi:hypothetical protein
MKKLYTILIVLFVTASTFAQAPEKMSYQAVLRDASNTLLTNQEVGMQISILQSTANGTAVYVETQTVTSNINGLVTLEIGTGSVVSGDFTTIDWSTDNYFIKTETDPAGGTTYTITGTSQLMSVPFAMYAKTSGNAAPGPQGAQGTQGIQGAAGAAGTDGTNGIQGTQGATGAVGADGAAGTDGTNGIQGIQGATGAVGVDGAAGTDGTNGTQGTQGATGTAGADGAAGTDGTDGTQGIQGATGTAGADGAAGTDGTQGIQGATGSAGTNGEKGEAGVAGTQGIQGAIGTAGTNGTNGAKGDVGEKGDTGDQGTQGIQGNIGSVGAVGATGTTGTNGAKGDTGITGAQGDVGEKGIQGATGADGASGETGAQGDQGAQGIQGTAGTNGEKGATGEQGAAGLTTAVNAIAQIDGNITLTTTDIPEGDNKYYTDALVSANTAVAANTLKVGYTEALVSANTDVAANIVKITNATHTGDVTGSTVLTITNDAVTTDKIKDNNVTDAKIVAVSASKLTGTVGIANGGTNITTYTQGDILYATSATELTKLPAGTAGQVLTMNTGATAPEWVAVTTATYAIGDTHQGGIIFYLDASGKHGLISAPTDQSAGIKWDNGSFVDTYAYGNGIGAGEGNSQGIRRWQGTCSSCYASELCQDLILGGETDWYLPSKYELNLMFENIGQGNALGLGNIGNFANNYYWSSTEIGDSGAWLQSFANGYQANGNKSSTYNVRAVRAF